MAEESPSKGSSKSKSKQGVRSLNESDGRAADLNERARLYPWTFFNQTELELMTGLPRQAVAAAFDAPDFPAQFGRSRPEDLVKWVREQDAKIQTKEVC